MNHAARRNLVVVDEARSTFKVDRNAFVEPGVMAAEYARVFDRSWLYLGHESELARNGDFVARTVARRNLVFTRDGGGKVHAFFNTCPHRGATVCREKSGNARTFQCFYHGWTFDLDGRLRGQPGKERYPEGFTDDGAINLVPVPRFESYAGFHFVSFDPHIVSLADYLAGAKAYLDLVAGYSESGMAIVTGAQEYSMRANWKLLVENSIDGYHAATTHASYLDYLKNTNGSLTSVALEGVSHDLGNGHAVLEYRAPWGRPIGQWIPRWGEQGKKEIDALNARLAARHGEELAKRMSFSNRNLLIYPNLVINDIMAITVRTFFPTSADHVLINGWALAPKDESDWARKYRLHNFLEFLGPGGFATPDDVEALESCQHGFQNAAGARWNDISKGLGRDGDRYDDERQMRVFWSRWNQQMAEPLPGESP